MVQFIKKIFWSGLLSAVIGVTGALAQVGPAGGTSGGGVGSPGGVAAPPPGLAGAPGYAAGSVPGVVVQSTNTALAPGIVTPPTGVTVVVPPTLPIAPQVPSTTPALGYGLPLTTFPGLTPQQTAQGNTAITTLYPGYNSASSTLATGNSYFGANQNATGNPANGLNTAPNANQATVSTGRLGPFPGSPVAPSTPAPQAPPPPQYATR